MSSGSGEYDTSFSKKLSRSNNSSSMNRKRSGANLAGTLRQLSGHVKQRRSEKLATNLSRLVSSLMQQQQREAGQVKSSLAAQYLIHSESIFGNNNNNSSSSSGSSGIGSKANKSNKAHADASELIDTDVLVLNSDFRAALTGALSRLDEIEDGKLTIEQFAAILTQLIGISTISLTTVLMGRFVDRDGDGYISADDIFAVQAMLMQKSEVFLRVSEVGSRVEW